MRHQVEPDSAEMAKRYGARPKRHMKEPDWHRPAFLWLNVRPRPSTGLLGATRPCLCACVDASAYRARCDVGSRRATSTSVSPWLAADAYRPYLAQMIRFRTLS
jgi:hypothetical protein